MQSLLKFKSNFPKCAWNYKRYQIVKEILKENKVRSHTSWLQTIYKSIVIKAVLYWHKNRIIDPWNRIQSLEINSSIFAQSVYNEAAKNMQGKMTVFSTNVKKKNWTAPCKGMKMNGYIIYRS